MKNIIIAQIVALIGLIFNSLSAQEQNKKHILIFNGLDNISCCISYILLGAYTGCIGCIVATLRNVVFARYKDNIPLYVLIIYYIIAITVTIPAYDGILSIIPLFNILLFGFALWQTNVKRTKIITIIVDTASVIYNAYNLALVNCISAIVSFTSASIGYAKCVKEEKIIKEKLV